MDDGQQPCDDFNPGGSQEAMYNWHECPGCPGTRRFCKNCNSDHHSSGWDKCLARERRAHAATREALSRLRSACVNAVQTYDSISEANAPTWLHELRIAADIERAKGGE